MIFYVIYLMFLLAVIALSPTREFSFALISFYSIIPGLAYCVIKHPSRLQTYLLVLLLLSYCRGKGTNFNLVSFDQKISDMHLVASSAIWMIAYLTTKMGLNSKMPGIYFKLYFVLLFIIGFLITGSQLLGSRSLDEGSNSAYYVLPLLPLMMYYFPKYKYHILAVTFIVLISTIKRSSIIIIVLSSLWLVYCWYKGIIKIKISKSKLSVVVTCVLLAIFLLGGVYINSIVSRFSNISEDGGSHRDLIYLYALDIINESDTSHLLYGNGPRYFWYSNSVISAAHNDFLEITVSCGVIGLIAFILLHVQLISWLVELVKLRKTLSIAYGISYIAFLVWNLVGCQFAYQSGAIGICMFWALVEKEINKYEKDSICGYGRRYGRRLNEHNIQKSRLFVKE